MRTLIVVADPLPDLRPEHDSTVALMEEAQRRGHRVLVTTVQQLAVRDTRAIARATPVCLEPAKVTDRGWAAVPDWWRPTGAPRDTWLDEVDAVLIRTDPPFDADYLRATYLLDRVDPHRTPVLNAPHGLREANEKLFALRFPDLIPDTVVSADPAQLADATREWGRAVLKPTDAMGGRGVLVLRADDVNLRSILEVATEGGRRHVITQRWVEPSGGDRRLIVVDGEPVGAIRRMPAPGDFRCNLAAGGHAEADSITAEDERLCRAIAPELSRLGILLAGVDVIGGQLIEVNVTSPTGLREVEALTEARPVQAVLDSLQRRWQSSTG